MLLMIVFLISSMLSFLLHRHRVRTMIIVAHTLPSSIIWVPIVGRWHSPLILSVFSSYMRRDTAMIVVGLSHHIHIWGRTVALEWSSSIARMMTMSPLSIPWERRRQPLIVPAKSIPSIPISKVSMMIILRSRTPSSTNTVMRSIISRRSIMIVVRSSIVAHPTNVCTPPTGRTRSSHHRRRRTPASSTIMPMIFAKSSLRTAAAVSIKITTVPVMFITRHSP
mmetsp:Transcript_17378/g.22597  ORF Transcript_17378/g.22597 Transcript_17378/m.22597 type:complete len:223 (+) Transcript_17378:725-1393(+)